jgi:hypothetical protein
MKTLKIRIAVLGAGGLDSDTRSKIFGTMYYVGDFYDENDVKFSEVQNNRGEIIRVFPERITLDIKGL